MKDLISIGTMAEINHIPISTLRYYDRLGLIKPVYVNEETGYRYYNIRQNARLDTIAYMKELGMSLHEIGAILQKEDIVLVEEILVCKNEQIHKEMQALKNRHDAVERAIHCIERYRKAPSKGTISLQYIDQRYIWGIRCSENFYDYDLSSYERVLSDLRDALMQKGCPQMHTYNTGTSVMKQDFLDRNFRADQVFIFLGRKPAERDCDYRVIESGMYLCIYTDDYDSEKAYAGRLLEECRDKNYTVTGDYICEVMTEFNVFDIEKRNMYLRLQVPVSFQKNAN